MKNKTESLVKKTNDMLPDGVYLGKWILKNIVVEYNGHDYSASPKDSCPRITTLVAVEVRDGEVTFEEFNN